MLQDFIELDHGRMGLVIGLIAIIGAMLTVISSIVAVQWRKSREAEIDAQLKLQMLDMGLKPEELALVLEAGKKGKRRDTKSLIQDWRKKMEDRAHACR
jgi:hypothetical protein